MDTSAYYPELSNDDPLFEIAEYTQVLGMRLVKPLLITRKTGNQVVGTTAEPVTWNAVDLARGLTFTSGGSVVTVTQTGVYQIIAKLASASATGTLGVNVWINGAVRNEGNNDVVSSSAAYAKILTVFDVPLYAGDTVEIRGKNSGFALSAVECGFSIKMVDTV